MTSQDGGWTLENHFKQVKLKLKLYITVIGQQWQKYLEGEGVLFQYSPSFSFK